MVNLAVRSHIDCRYGLEQPQGGTDFWRAFSGAEFEEGSSRGGDASWCTEDGVWRRQLKGRCC